MYKSYEFSIEIWPGVVRVHQAYDTEDSQTIELDPSQIDGFCENLKRLSVEARELGEEFAKAEPEMRAKKSVRPTNSEI